MPLLKAAVLLLLVLMMSRSGSRVMGVSVRKARSCAFAASIWHSRVSTMLLLVVVLLLLLLLLLLVAVMVLALALN
jgi:hypothetical protein